MVLALATKLSLQSCRCYLMTVVAVSLLGRPVSGSYARDDRFMSDVSLERFYVLEENALSNADVLLRDEFFSAADGLEESEQEHQLHLSNLTSIKRIINEAKDVHRVAATDLETFLAHPINVYHLFRRLDDGWREGLKFLLQTEPCKRWNLPTMVERLRYLLDSLPGHGELVRLVEYISKLQKIYGIEVKDIAAGKIGDAVAQKPLTLQEQFDILKILHEKEDTKAALDWLRQIFRLLSQQSPDQKKELSFSEVDVLNIMASAYYDVGSTADAVDITNRVLQIDPNNKIAENNLIFLKNKLAIEMGLDESGWHKSRPPQQELSQFEHLCGRKQRRKASRKKCRLVRIGLIHYKMEPVRYKPYIVFFHDVVRNKTTEVLKTYAHDMQTDQAWSNEETFRPPNFGISLDLWNIRKTSVQREAESLQRQLLVLSTLANEKLDVWEKPQVINVGLEGIHLSQHWYDLNLFRSVNRKRRKETGAYYVFLNNVMLGGQVVFTDHKLVLQPEKGSVLFYYHSKTALHSFCPVSGNSLWVAVYPIREQARNYCVAEDYWL